MSIPSNSPRVRLRLSTREIGLILPALRKIVAADVFWTKEGRIARAFEDPDFYQHVSNTKLYSSTGMRPFTEALTRISLVSAAGGRIRFSAHELAACMFSARHTRTMVHHRHVAPWLEDHHALADKLLAKLERYRRRARRRFEEQLGNDRYVTAAKAGRDIMTWIHAEYLWCRCNRLKGTGLMRRWYRKIVDRCCVLAVEGLLRHSVCPPPPAELRGLVRRALRSARRRINAPAVGALWRRPEIGHQFLAEFILRTQGAALRHNDMATRLSRYAERLRLLTTIADSSD